MRASIVPTRSPSQAARQASRVLTRWLLVAEWRSHPARTCVAIVAIALGVALGYAVQLINGAAFNEFSAAARSLSGQSDLQVRGVQPWFDEAVYPRLARLPEVAVASPLVELDASVPGQRAPLKVLGIDAFAASRISPDLIGVQAPGKPFDMLADDTIFLSLAAQQWLGVHTGDRLTLRSGTRNVTLRVAGALARTRAGQRIAVMDIGTAQWRFGRVGKLSRIDLKLAPGVDRETFRRALQKTVGDRMRVSESRDETARANTMSRAYRVNLDVLALVALFTGAFLVFSVQALSVIRRRPQFALLRVLGLARGQLVRHILYEGMLLGAVGAVCGLAMGYGVAAAVLHYFGGDLGGGYFPGVQPTVHVDGQAAAIFLALGVSVAVLGSVTPALEASRARPAPALRSGSEEHALARLATPWPALVCLLGAAGLTQLPPVAGLPVFGYAAVALLLIGAVALMPRFCAIVFSAVQAHGARTRRGVIATLTLARLAHAPGQASIALGGVLSSFSLIVAMAIMVSSFRVSVDDWLTHLLSADVYVRSASGGDTASLRPAEQARLAAVPGVAHAAFTRTASLTLDTARPAVAVLARDIDIADPARSLPLTGRRVASGAAAGALPVWVSEAMVDLYHYRVGERVRLPIGTADHDFTVAGVWRDYARQSGAIQIRLSDYRRLTGDSDATEAALTLKRGADPATVIAAIRALPFGKTLSVSQPADIRALALTIFDRSFAVTYLLEAIAIVIGLFGVGATFSAQTLARAQEFGMLRHVGVTRRQVLLMLAAEGGLLGALGSGFGFILGWTVGLILVFVVNPQSFHWTMQLHIPWRELAGVALVLLASASVTAVVAGLRAVSLDAVRAVREDW